MKQQQLLREIAFYLEGLKKADTITPLGQVHLDALWEVSKRGYATGSNESIADIDWAQIEKILTDNFNPTTGRQRVFDFIKRQIQDKLIEENDWLNFKKCNEK